MAIANLMGTQRWPRLDDSASALVSIRPSMGVVGRVGASNGGRIA